VQANPFMAQLLRNPETVAPEPSAATVAPQPRPATAAPNTRGSRRPSRGHDGTMDSPAAQGEPSVDRDTHHVTSPTPTPESFPPGVTPPPAPPTSPTSVAPGLANPGVTQHTTTPGSTVAGSRDTTHPNAKNPVEKGNGKAQADASDPKRPAQPEDPIRTTPWRGRSRKGHRKT